MPHTVKVAVWSALADEKPHAARAAGIDLVVVRIGEAVHVLHGRCPHRGAPMSEGCLDGPNLVCKAHCWDFYVETGASAHVEGERLQPFSARIDRDADAVLVDDAEILAWQEANPQAFEHSEFLGG
jgi:nitrite reductase/ring-hydroxylating ferredoxin subunit